MKQLIAFIRKEAMHIFRDPRTMLVLFLMPVAQLLIFGYVISTEIKDARIGVLDKAHDYSSRQLVDRLSASGYFRVVDYLQSEHEIESAFRKGDFQMAVVIGEGFGNKMVRPEGSRIQLIADASDANTAQMLVNYASGIVSKYGSEQMAFSAHGSIETEVRMFFNPALKGVYMSIPGIMAMVLILVSAMMTSISITREKEFGSMEVLLISPLKPFQIILGKVTPYVVLSFINALTIIIIGVFVFKVPVVGSMFWLLVINFIYILLALSLGIFISTVAKSQMVAMFISMVGLMLPTILLSGFIFPVASMPKALQVISVIMPARWYIQAMKTVMFKSGELIFIWKELLILISFFVVFMVLSVRNFKVRLQ
jgi:ABC-2 type transport system permease protein